jgi:glycosyltransferase involved in cell wall biosynthesis
MNSPKASVLIPVYNGERHLPECLDSVLAQDFRDLEILLSDDGSTDGSAKIIENYAARNSHLRWWRNPKNLGLTANTNVCIRAAQGEYLKFVHQDDLLLSASAISKLAAELDRNPGVSLAACRQHLTGTGSRPLVFCDRTGIYDGRRMIVASLERNTNLIGQPTLTLFRRRQAQRGFDERFTGFMDFEMWCHLLEQGDFAYLTEELASWRVHGDQQTARHAASRETDMEHLRFMEIYYAKPWLRAAATDRMLFAQIYYLEKKHGREARGLTDLMRSHLKCGRFVWQWLKHKAGRPWGKLGRKLAGR